ncbi:DUF4124 domain-containing protein [Dyella sedimenti]|uniref:DUF4124 domain-containing protein n=1 Tax=Dyella sedimenti TaxID=2919947 RepID=UPI001FAA9B77|nr:DUF4124 domain-containing protein [Dyella sedimenti]
MTLRQLTWLLLLLPMGARAQDGIHRCIGPGGNPLFTDQPCAALQATPVAVAPPATDARSNPEDVPATAPPPPVLCAASVDALRRSVQEAFASHNPNRLAGLMLWNGYGHDAVVADIRSLDTLMQRPLLEVGEAPSDSAMPGDAGAPVQPPGDDAFAPPSPSAIFNRSQLVVRTAGDGGTGTSHETRFGMVRRSGCWWLRDAD